MISIGEHLLYATKAARYSRAANDLAALGDHGASLVCRNLASKYERLSNSLPTPAATPTDSANPPPVESVGPNSTGDA